MKTKNPIVECLDPSPLPKQAIKTITAPTPLNVLHDVVKIPDGKSAYYVTLPDGENLVLICSQDARKPIAEFKHPNLAAVGNSILNFKHSRKGGSRFWTTIPGRDFYFVIPKSKITLIPTPGNSYVPIEVNGVKVSLNVSGGDWHDGWADHVSSCCHTRVGHTLKDMKALAAVAIPESIQPKAMDSSDQKAWEDAMNAHLCPPLLVKAVQENKNPKIVLRTGYYFSAHQTEGPATEVAFGQKLKWEPDPNDPKRRIGTLHKTARIRHFVIQSSLWGGGVRVPPSKIDWTQTLAALKNPAPAEVKEVAK